MQLWSLWILLSLQSRKASLDALLTCEQTKKIEVWIERKSSQDHLTNVFIQYVV
uniref:Ulk1 n=1 Tax=Acanthopagrus schlegelii TaxID=72011 RepID=A0AA94X319_ACASC|nr:ulk1 [Acanthopagrus schlegelii]